MTQIEQDLKKLLEEGVDDYWWTLDKEGNFSLINRLRKSVGLEEITTEKLKEIKEYWHVYR